MGPGPSALSVDPDAGEPAAVVERQALWMTPGVMVLRGWVSALPVVLLAHVQSAVVLTGGVVELGRCCSEWCLPRRASLGGFDPGNPEIKIPKALRSILLNNSS